LDFRNRLFTAIAMAEFTDYYESSLSLSKSGYSELF
jgi:hypothetical protein